MFNSCITKELKEHQIKKPYIVKFNMPCAVNLFHFSLSRARCKLLITYYMVYTLSQHYNRYEIKPLPVA